MKTNRRRSRRTFLKSLSGAVLGSAVVPTVGRPGIGALSAPRLEHGIQIGDVHQTGAIVWSRADRPSRMLVEFDFDERFKNAKTLRGPHALESTDYTARIDLAHLPADTEVFARVRFQDLTNDRKVSDPVGGHFRTAPWERRDIRFLVSGDTAGQGWGINPEFGGMRIYETMRRTQPDFFIHSGDNVYADGPIPETQKAENGETWRNIVTPEVAKVAETLDEFRGRYRYNMLDENVRRFNAEVPQLWQWDDHEVVNNWSDSKDLTSDDRYKEKNVPTLIGYGTQAFLDYAPLRPFDLRELERVYRHVPFGRHLDVFVIDKRSYRGPNTFNRQPEPGPDTALLGREQIEWLKRNLKASRSTWKVIASDMPIGLLAGDGVDAKGRPRFENAANGDGPVLGREFEIADILSFIKKHRIQNVVWVTADVHYTAAHHYDPARAQFRDFLPFWEFVTGPLNAGSFGPNALDNTFGPKVVFQKAPPGPNYSPFAGLQFFGQFDIDGRTGVMTVQLKDLDGKSLFTRALQPARDGEGNGGNE